MTVRCPACGGLQVGKVGSDQFYCWNCYLEFNFHKGRVNLYEVAEDGSLIAMDNSSEMI
ncbi:MAG: hypothetical protein GXZ09_07475 [Syntrophomonadaceae bacterium]|jgi:hypothetical protein|nr:hypothetical protein [Syntrophomonadaceae bacterium]